MHLEFSRGGIAGDFEKGRVSNNIKNFKHNFALLWLELIRADMITVFFLWLNLL